MRSIRACSDHALELHVSELKLRYLYVPLRNLFSIFSSSHLLENMDSHFLSKFKDGSRSSKDGEALTRDKLFCEAVDKFNRS